MRSILSDFMLQFLQPSSNHSPQQANLASHLSLPLLRLILGRLGPHCLRRLNSGERARVGRAELVQQRVGRLGLGLRRAWKWGFGSRASLGWMGWVGKVSEPVSELSLVGQEGRLWFLTILLGYSNEGGWPAAGVAAVSEAS